MKQLLSLKPYLLKYKKNLWTGFFFIVLHNLFAVAAPTFIGKAVDGMSKAFPLSAVLTDISFYLLLTLLGGYFLYLVRQRIIVTSRHIEFDLKNNYYQHLQRLPRSFYNTTTTGELISRGTNDMNAIREFVGPGIMYSFNTFFRLVFAIIAMVAISPSLTFYALLPAPLLSYLVYKIGSSMQKRSKRIQESYAAITNLVQENIAGIRVVKNYNREAFEIERFRQLNNDYYNKNLSLGKLQALFFAFLTSMTALSLLPVIWIGGMYAVKGTITIGDIAQFIVYVSMLSWPIISIGWVTSIIQKAAAAQLRLQEILNVQPEIENSEKGDGVPEQATLRFENVSFAYAQHEAHPVLKKLSFEIPAGSKVAIVGATGSGKSSLVSLIPRLYDPTEGRVTLDGYDLRSIPLQRLREMVGFVPQINFLFSDTIANNIMWGKRGDEAETEAVDAIIEASKIAMLHHDVVDFPEQYNTMLGEKGINLSGGQKQRACIARAVAWQPKLLVLDDALSAVDTDTEARLFEALLQKLPNTTILLISHRISTVKNCDRIMVLHEGEIVESGTHEELLERQHLYAELYNQQLLEEEILSM